MAWWLVGAGVAFGGDLALGDVFLPMAENHWGVASPITAAIALVEHWLAVTGPVAGIGLFGLFPSGRPERRDERAVIWTVTLAGLVIPLLEAVSGADVAPAGGPAWQRAARRLPRPVRARPGPAGRRRQRGLPHQPGLAADRPGPARPALPGRRGTRRRQLRWLLVSAWGSRRACGSRPD